MRQRRIGGIRSSAGIEANYARRLQAEVAQMHNSVNYWVTKAYPRAVLAMDAVQPPGGRPPLWDINATLTYLLNYWRQRFDALAPWLASYFTQKVERRVRSAMMKKLKDAGVTVRFQVTPAMAQAIDQLIYDNVQLIRSIPQEHLADVEKLVHESVWRGRDLHYLTTELQRRYDITKDRANLIAMHQNNLATNQLQKVRWVEHGMHRAVWQHSHAGKVPRPSHVANDGNEFDLSTGWYDPDEGKYILPGELINCRCWMTAVLPPVM
jgi:uncharacterized protein with gpF-like domain